MKKILVTLSYLALFSANLFADAIDEKVELYRQSIETMTTYYQWSFGLVFTVLILIVTGNIIQNKSSIKKEVEEAKEEIKKTIQQEKDKQEKVYSELKANYDITMKNKINEMHKFVEIEILEIKISIENSKKVKLSYAVQLLILLSKLHKESTNYDWKFQQYITYISNCIDESIRFSTYEADDINEMFSLLPSRFSSEKDKLIKKDLYEK